MADNILIAGDFFPVKENASLYASGDVQQLLGTRIVELFHQASFSICNLEGVLTNSCTPISKFGPNIKASPNHIEALSSLGIDCVTLANNHSGDFGIGGLDDTKAILSERGINYIGLVCDGEDGTHCSVVLNNKKITFYSVSEKMFNTQRQGVCINLYDEYRVCNELSKLREQCDFLIVLYHGGMEFYWYVTPEVKKKFYRMADSGADMVIAQHTHSLTCREEYNGSFLHYGQGDFQFSLAESRRQPYKKHGIILELVIGDSISVKEHLVEHANSLTRYANNQYLESYNIRNKRLSDGDSFDVEFKEYCSRRLMKFLPSIHGSNISLIDRLYKRFLSNEEYKHYLLKKYTKQDLLGLISCMEFEEFREFVLSGVWDLVE